MGKIVPKRGYVCTFGICLFENSMNSILHFIFFSFRFSEANRRELHTAFSHLSMMNIGTGFQYAVLWATDWKCTVFPEPFSQHSCFQQCSCISGHLEFFFYPLENWFNFWFSGPCVWNTCYKRMREKNIASKDFAPVSKCHILQFFSAIEINWMQDPWHFIYSTFAMTE